MVYFDHALHARAWINRPNAAARSRREVVLNTTIGDNNAAIGLRIPIIPDKCKIMLDLYTILFVYSYMEKRGKMMSFG